MYELKARSHFDAAHYIKDYEGKCNREHGHRWIVEACLRGDRLDSRNILWDFGEVKNRIDAVLDANYDHYQLNERLHQPNVTAEFLARELFQVLKKFGWNSLELASVEVWESPECSIRYTGEDDPIRHILKKGMA